MMQSHCICVIHPRAFPNGPFRTSHDVESTVDTSSEKVLAPLDQLRPKESESSIPKPNSRKTLSSSWNQPYCTRLARPRIHAILPRRNQTKRGVKEQLLVYSSLRFHVCPPIAKLPTGAQYGVAVRNYPSGVL
jgi:hypothetical protein